MVRTGLSSARRYNSLNDQKIRTQGTFPGRRHLLCWHDFPARRQPRPRPGCPKPSEQKL